MVKKEIKLPSVLTGVSGEYFVAAELTRRKYIASITLRNTKGIDILASNQKASKSIGIQVKTNSTGNKSWILNKKAEKSFADNLYYIFVVLGNIDEQPIFHIVPSKIVASQLRRGHSKWLKTPGKGGRKHKDTPMRVFYDKENKYLKRWDLLKL